MSVWFRLRIRVRVRLTSNLRLVVKVGAGDEGTHHVYVKCSQKKNRCIVLWAYQRGRVSDIISFSSYSSWPLIYIYIYLSIIKFEQNNKSVQFEFWLNRILNANET